MKKIPFGNEKAMLRPSQRILAATPENREECFTAINTFHVKRVRNYSIHLVLSGLETILFDSECAMKYAYELKTPRKYFHLFFHQYKGFFLALELIP